MSVLMLKCLQHGYHKFCAPKTIQLPVLKLEESNRLIYDMLCLDNPCMIARYGATEIACVMNYLAIKKQNRNIWKYIKEETGDWWWNTKIMNQMQQWSGFFPPTKEKLTEFCELMLDCSAMLDILAIIESTTRYIPKLIKYTPANMNLVPIVSLDSFVFNIPWTRALKGKKIVVVHPFSELIEHQYNKRLLLFNNDDVLPDFQLRTIKAVQSLGGVNNGFSDWFEALGWMETEMDKMPYDIALIGCGAYGFPLAAHAKRTGHKAVHIGGSLQLLFGIKGKRWEKPMYGTKYGLPEGIYSKILNNPEWVRPDKYRTIESENVENACYW